jgi:hypothetical protein
LKLNIPAPEIGFDEYHYDYWYHMNSMRDHEQGPSPKEDWLLKFEELSKLPVTQPNFPQVDEETSAIDTLFAAINGLLAYGLRNTTLLNYALIRSIELKKHVITRNCLKFSKDKDKFSDPEFTATTLIWDCSDSVLLPILYGIPYNTHAMIKVADYAVIFNFSEANLLLQRGLPVEMGSKRNIVEAIDLVKQAVMKSDESTVGMICVRLRQKLDRNRHEYGGTIIPLSLMHVFTIAIAREGIRVFQGMQFGQLPVYKLHEYIRMGGARLRAWDEANEFIQQLVVLQTSVRISVPLLKCEVPTKIVQTSLTPEVLKANQYCFELDIQRAVPFFQENVCPAYALERYDVSFTSMSFPPVSKKDIIGRYKWNLMVD